MKWFSLLQHLIAPAIAFYATSVATGGAKDAAIKLLNQVVAAEQTIATLTGVTADPNPSSDPVQSGP